MSLILVTPSNPAGADGGAAWQTPLVELTAPATATAIPVDNSYSIFIAIGAGAETNTLAVPTFAGQQLALLAISVGGGTRAITAASAINQAGNTIMTFASANDFILLEAAATSATTFVWRVAANDGVALS